MRTPQFILPLADELVVDLFAGGGGASTGIEAAIGRHVDIAVNHDPEAVSLHQVNHPQTEHHVSNVWEVDPRTVCRGRPIGLLWASPDCTFHSKARGGKPHRDRNKARRRRGLASVVVKWVRLLKPTDQHPRVIHLENVEEFQFWGPLLPDGTPCPERRGTSFQRWVAQLRNLGYQVENPAEGPAEASYEAYLCRGLLQLLTCDTVALLPGWERSRGARIEHQVARALGMRIETLSGVVPQPVCAPVVLAPASRLFMSSTAA